MTVTHSSQHSDDKQGLAWTRHETVWMLSLFGTAVGAGILFLPINSGIGGFWPLVIMALLIGPMTYFSHRGLARFVCSGNSPDDDITEVVIEHFGPAAGQIITILYFLAIYPILLIYGVGITNTVASFLEHQLGILGVPRWLLSGILVAAMTGVMVTEQRTMLMVTQWMVYPLVVILIFLSLYLIPQWNLSMLRQTSSVGLSLSTIWLTLPVLVFSFSHSAAISQFSVAMQRKYGAEKGGKKADLVLRNTAVMLLGFVMLFVFSCVLSLSPAQLAAAKEQNIPVLSYLANVHDSAFISYFGPAIAFVAIVSSFFGHYLGAAEGLKGIVRGRVVSPRFAASRRMDYLTAAFIFLTCWAVAILNPSILGMIEVLSGPVIAMILYLMPMYAIHKVPALARYRGALSNVFVTITGILAVSAIFYLMF